MTLVFEKKLIHIPIQFTHHWNSTMQRSSLAPRFGLSLLEFLCCIVAVFGGIWLGAFYLGVDVRHVAHTALSETELLEKVPPEWRPQGPQDSVTRAELVETLREELGSLKHEISQLRGDESREAWWSQRQSRQGRTNWYC